MAHAPLSQLPPLQTAVMLLVEQAIPQPPQWMVEPELMLRSQPLALLLSQSPNPEAQLPPV